MKRKAHFKYKFLVSLTKKETKDFDKMWDGIEKKRMSVSLEKQECGKN